MLDVLAAMGASVEIQSSDASGEPIGSLTVRRQDLRGTRLSGDLVVRAIDEIPILAVLATQAHGRTEIRDAQELRVKECDRISTVVAMLRSMGANVTELDDGMVIDGPTPLCSAIIDTQHDHRIAMSAAIAALCTQDGLPTRIRGADIAEVSYPGFYLALDGLRMSIHQVEMSIDTRSQGRGLYDITANVNTHLCSSGATDGLVNVFVRHTSCSLLIQENADPTASRDLVEWFDRLAPEGDPRYTHTLEGPDDMPAHLRAAVTRTSEQIR